MGRHWIIFMVSLFVSVASADPAETIRFLPRGDQSMAARLIAIKSAKTSIDLATYIFNPCQTVGQLLLGALVKKADQGVKVRLLVDDYEWTQYQKAGLSAFLAKHHIQFKVFNDQTKIPAPPTPRLHAKILLIDGGSDHAIYFAGGRNSSNGYFGLSKHINYFDQDLEISGPSGHTVQKSFDLVWAAAEAPTFYQSAQNFESSCLANHPRSIEAARYFGANAQAIFDSLQPLQCPSVDFRMDEAKPVSRLGAKLTTALVLDFLAGTKSNLNVVNQYYIPPDKEQDAFDELRERRHLPILILTNMTADPGGLIMQKMTSDMVVQVKRDSHGSMSIAPISSLGNLRDDWKLTDPKSIWRIHTKSFVRDHRDVLIGSYNLDQLSYSENIEAAVTINGCPALAHAVEAEHQHLLDIYEKDKKSCADCQKQARELFPLLDLLVEPASAYF